jgi:GT2 family glycosyltransferase
MPLSTVRRANLELVQGDNRQVYVRTLFMDNATTLIIILHYGSIEDTLTCLNSLRRSIISPFDAFVVNNGRDQEVESTVKTNHPETLYHNAGPETGFAAGNNIGLRFSVEHGYRYSLLLNNDTVAERDFLQPLMKVMEQDQAIAMAGPAMYLYNNKEQLWTCGGRIRQWSGHINGITDIGQLRSDATDVDYLPGACILVRNNALGKIGLMSEEYFLGYEEADWAIQARRARYRVVACAKSVLFHKVGVSSRFTPELVYNSFRNRFLFFRRQFRMPLSWILIACVLASGLRKNSLSRRLRWRAFKDHLKYHDIRRSHLNAVRVEMKNERDLRTL